jgi:integrase
LEDIEETAGGLTVTIRRGKTDQAGEGRKVGIPAGADPATCPVRALKEWRRTAAIESGAVFRVMNRHGQVLGKRLSAEAVAIVVKRSVRQLGYDPTTFGGHSLRAGLATSAAAAGKSERAIMNQTGHRSVVTVRRYIRDGDLFRENAAGGIGL